MTESVVSLLKIKQRNKISPKLNLLVYVPYKQSVLFNMIVKSFSNKQNGNCMGMC